MVFRGFMKHVPLGAVKNVLLVNGDAAVDDVDGGSVDDVVGVDGGDNVYDCVMKMITDLRSNKVKELEGFHNQKNKRGNNNSMEMVWW